MIALILNDGESLYLICFLVIMVEIMEMSMSIKKQNKNMKNIFVSFKFPFNVFIEFFFKFYLYTSIKYNVIN